MGTYIHLSIGNLQIDWGKNHGFTDHSILFQQNNLADVPTWYVKDDDARGSDTWSLYPEFKKGLSSPLWKVIERLNMLGYTFDLIKEIYDNDYYEIFEDELNRITFDQLASIFKKCDISIIMSDREKAQRTLETKLTKQLVQLLLEERKGEKFQLDDIIDADSPFSLSPYVLLHLIFLNPASSLFPVSWDFDDIIQSGWAKESDFVKQLNKSDRFLLVTEGSSDTSILRQAFQRLRPQIEDFFDYVDMAEGYPFTGTGNQVNFVKGLISIGIQNNVLVIFDNDTEGKTSYEKCLKLNIPSNMRILKLPDLPQFENFLTIGPNGQHISNINGRAAAIECYLDLGTAPLIRWNNYSINQQTYQGELIGKDNYKTHFFNQKINEGKYDYTKIEAILNLITNAAIEIKSKSK